MANRPHIAYRHSTNVRSINRREWATRQVFKALSFGSPRLLQGRCEARAAVRSGDLEPQHQAPPSGDREAMSCHASKRS